MTAPSGNEICPLLVRFILEHLACSMPFSVLLIMTVYASGAFFATPSKLLGFALTFIAAGIGILVLSRRRWVVVKAGNSPIDDAERNDSRASSHA